MRSGRIVSNARLDFTKIAENKVSIVENFIKRSPKSRVSPSTLVDSVLATRSSLVSVRADVDALNSKRKSGAFSTEEKIELSRKKRDRDALTARLEAECAALPNASAPDTPVAEFEVVSEHLCDDVNFSESIPKTPFGEGVYFESTTKTTGSRFATLKGFGVELELGLIRFAIDELSASYQQDELLQVPDVVRSEFLEGCGYNPRDDASPSQTYEIADSDLVLVGTSEISLAGRWANSKLSATHRMLGLSHCFRTEAGAAGSKNPSGLFRLHQFTKLEMFTLCEEEDGRIELERLLKAQKGLLQALELPHRVIRMGYVELGNAAFEKYDVEVWAGGRWIEVCSVSDCAEFQTRRLNIKSGRKKKQFMRSLNATGIATPRIMTALLERRRGMDLSTGAFRESLPLALKRFL